VLKREKGELLWMSVIGEKKMGFGEQTAGMNLRFLSGLLRQAQWRTVVIAVKD